MAAFTDILSRLDEFLYICKELSLHTEAETGRFGVYRSRIIKLNGEIDRLRAGEPGMPIRKRLASELPHYLVALAESQEVGAFVPFLRCRPAGEVVPRVRAILSGPELPSDEDHSSNQARNIQFELLLAATLWRAGVQVELAEPDIRCEIDGATLLFACKRLLSVRRLNKRINEATEQLQRSLAVFGKDNSWGIIAVSLSRVLAKVEQSVHIRNRGEGRTSLESRIDGLVTRRAKWCQTREAQGIVFHIASMFTNSETDRIESGSFLTLHGDGPVCEALAIKLTSIADAH